MKSFPYLPHYKNLRRWLKAQRVKHGFSLRDISDLMNRHHSIVGKMEQDRLLLNVFPMS